MKTSRVAFVSTGAALVALLATAAFAGPSPQYWNRPPASPATPPAKAAAPACAGCKTTTRWTPGDRSPAGKGAASVVAVGQMHTCAFCAGARVTEKNAVKSTLTREAPACTSLGCCR